MFFFLILMCMGVCIRVYDICIWCLDNQKRPSNPLALEVQVTVSWDVAIERTEPNSSGKVASALNY